MAISGWANADDEDPTSVELGDPLGVIEEETESTEVEAGNPSDPTASVKYTDLRFRYLDLGSGADRLWGSALGSCIRVDLTDDILWELKGAASARQRSKRTP